MKTTSNEYEKLYSEYSICGIDEAGRGPLAGPLVVAGVMFNKYYENNLIYDSKGISEKRRNELFNIIKKDAFKYVIKIVEVEEIDKLNIYQATKKAMEDIAISLNADITLTDAMKLDIDKKVIPIIKGDQKSVNIAAASILAKVTRDNIMSEYDKKYPQYDFINNKGYPTKKHLEAIEKYGILDIHRKSYAPIKNKIQLTLDL